MNIGRYFADDFKEARERFTSACGEARIAVDAFENPGLGPGGGSLYTDVGRCGEPQGDRLLVVCSGTHGVEGFCGSGCLTAWVCEGGPESLPMGVRVVLIHAINPYGFAWCRRVNEDNVDLNRNFIDHDRSAPNNTEYEDLHPHLLPEVWDDETPNALAGLFERYDADHGTGSWQDVLSRGQYARSDGLFYGGNKETWSNRTFRKILQQHAPNASKVAFIDFHTGLGPYAHGELICETPDTSPQYSRLIEWFGPAVKSVASGESTSPDVNGTIHHAFEDAASDAEVTCVAPEFGTYSLDLVFGILVRDNWLHVNGLVDSPQGEASKREIREAFFPSDQDWRSLVGLRALQLMRRATSALAA